MQRKNNMDIEKLLKDLTLEEKCALLSGIDSWHTTPILRLGIPSVNCADGPYGLRKEVPTEKVLTIAPSQPATCFPLPVTMASTWDADIMERIGKAYAEEAIDQGVQTVLGPGVNIKRSPLCGRNFEYYSEDPYLAGCLATRFVQGIQSKGVGTSLKHFAANSQEYRRMMISSEVDERAFREIYLPAFEMTVKESQPYTVMCSYNRINGVFASENKYLLTDILRNEWGFNGIVISDWGAVNDRALGVKAGLDVEMPSTQGVYDREVLNAVKSGLLSEKDLDTVVARTLRYVGRASENEKDRKVSICDYEAHHQIAREAAASGIVLLKNDRNLLPLKSGKSLAVIGHMAKKMRFEGSGSSQINPKNLVNFTDVLDREHISYSYADGYCFGTGVDELKFAEAVAVAKDKDAVLLFIGLTEDYESEGFDRPNMDLPKGHDELVKKILEVNKNVIVILSIGSPVKMPWIGSVDSVLNLYLGGEAMGEAAYDVIFGKVSPSGKLAETFPFSLSDNPANKHFRSGPKTVEYRESIYVGYRYFDKAKKDVQFSFGYGLSYTRFEYSNLSLSTNHVKDGNLVLTFDLHNAGLYDGAEVAQVYVRDLDSTIFREDKALKGFKKVFLKAGETKTVSISLNSRAWSFYDVTIHDWAIESGHYDVLVGASSRDIRLKENIYVEGNTKTIPDYKKTAPVYYSLVKAKEYPAKQFIAILGHPVNENKRYTRKTLDENATLLDAKRISLNGWIFYRVLRSKVAKMMGKGSSKAVRKMARESALVGPLRQLISFTSGAIGKQTLTGIILIIKGRLFKGLKLVRKGNKATKKTPLKSAIFGK